MDEHTTPEENMQIAQEELAQHDLPHATFHVAWALFPDPQNREAQDLFDQIIAAAPDPLALIPVQEHMQSVEGAAQAYIAAKGGDINTALYILGLVNSVETDGRFLPWAAQWISEDKNNSIDKEIFLNFLGALISTYPGDTISDEQTQTRVAQVVESASRYVEAAQDAQLTVFYALLLRKVGRYADSLKKAQESYAAAPSATALIAMSYAYQRLDQPEEALASLEKALVLEPTLIQVYNDIGDLLVRLGRLPEAVAAYSKVLDQRSSDPWAAPSYYYYQQLVDPNSGGKDKLLAIAQANPDNQRAADLVKTLPRPGMPYMDFLPEPRDALIQMAKQIVSQKSKYKERFVPIGMSALEAPSAVMALQRSIAPLRAVISVGRIQIPDPRVSSTPVAYTLWTYHETDPIPALLPKSSIVVVKAMTQIASTPYRLPEWSHQASECARELGEEALEELLAVMVHPPTPPDTQTEWEWIQNIQLAAALTIAHLSQDWERPSQKKGFEDVLTEPAPRQKALHALLFGAMDWTVSAAIIALTSIALNEPERESQILRWFRDSFYQIPQGSYVCYSATLAICGLLLPSMNEMALREDFIALLASG
jgi:tetratricopeptide (TPR) repeat protein